MSELTPRHAFALMYASRFPHIYSGIASVMGVSGADFAELTDTGHLRKTATPAEYAITSKGMLAVEKMLRTATATDDGPRAGFFGTAPVVVPNPIPRGPVFARFVRAMYNGKEYAPGRSVSVNAADVVVFTPGTDGNGDELPHVTTLILRNGHEYAVLCGYDQTAQRLAEASSNPYE